MTKEWICLICKRYGDLTPMFPPDDTPGYGRYELAVKQHFAMCASDEQTNKSMRGRFPGFSGPMTNCSGDIRLRPLPVKPKPADNPLVFGGDEPWI